jgi:hypothetical protein
MPGESNEREDVSRRQFLHGAAGTAAALAGSEPDRGEARASGPARQGMVGSR